MRLYAQVMSSVGVAKEIEDSETQVLKTITILLQYFCDSEKYSEISNYQFRNFVQRSLHINRFA